MDISTFNLDNGYAALITNTSAIVAIQDKFSGEIVWRTSIEELQWLTQWADKYQ